MSYYQTPFLTYIVLTHIYSVKCRPNCYASCLSQSPRESARERERKRERERERERERVGKKEIGRLELIHEVTQLVGK